MQTEPHGPHAPNVEHEALHRSAQVLAMIASHPPLQTHHARRACQGFTMVEVLVALFIVAVTLISGIKASSTLIQSAERQRSNLLAQVCIDNYLVAIRLSKQLPGTGEQVVSCEQALQTLTLKAQINTTPNPSFRRVDIQAFEQTVPILRVSTVLGLL